MIGAGELTAKVVMGQQEGEKGLPIPADYEEESQDGIEETSDVGEGIQDGIEWNVINILLFLNFEEELVDSINSSWMSKLIVEAIELETLRGLLLGLKGEDRFVFVDGTFFKFIVFGIIYVLSNKWSLYHIILNCG